MIGEPKRVAIDAYMRNEAHKGKSIERFARVGETYRTFSNYLGGGAEIVVTRPDAAGKNGGKVWKATTGYQGNGGRVGDDPDQQ